MKKLLLVSTALAGVAFVSSPASAALKMDLGGYFEGYGVYADNNNPTADHQRDFEFRRNNEIFFNGESTLDNGLTVGAHTQLDLANTNGAESATTTLTGTTATFTATTTTGSIIASHLAATTSVSSTSSNLVDETYLYASGGWGRVNFGEEDGAAYLLQVAAPSADSNVDGMRVYIQGLNTANWSPSLAGLALSYDQADFRQTDRLTYLTPKFNGFQAGVSYAPKTGTELINGVSAGNANMSLDDVAGEFQNPWEAAARWDGEFSGVALSLGAGYSDAEAQDSSGVATTGVGSTSLKTYNFGGNVAMSGFSLGGAYKHTNSGIETDGDIATWVVGAGYDNGPYHAGLSYFHDALDSSLLTGTDAGDKSTIHRYAAGAGYTFGPGMTFRGSVDWGSFQPSGDAHSNFTQATVGTDVQF